MNQNQGAMNRRRIMVVAVLVAMIIAVVAIYRFNAMQRSFDSQTADNANLFETQKAILDANDRLIGEAGVIITPPSVETGNEVVAVGIDAWGNPLQYSLPSEGFGYFISSAGPDGLFDTADDLPREFDVHGVPIFIEP